MLEFSNDQLIGTVLATKPAQRILEQKKAVLFRDTTRGVTHHYALMDAGSLLEPCYDLFMAVSELDLRDLLNNNGLPYKKE